MKQWIFTAALSISLVCGHLEVDYSVFPVKDGDKVTAEAILNRFENKLEIKGAVYRLSLIHI